MVTLRPKCKANERFEVKDNNSWKGICGNENEDLEVVNKWKEQVEKEQVKGRERDQDRDLRGEANGKVRKTGHDRESDGENGNDSDKDEQQMEGDQPEGIRNSHEYKPDFVESDETEQDPGDARQMRKMADPCLPTRAEVEEHRLTHLPFRSWCPHCIKGRGAERGHLPKEIKTQWEKCTWITVSQVEQA
jgi:hypothetical protein